SKGVQLCDFHTQKPVILVMGGSLGSQVLNGALRANLDRLLEQFQIVHLVGKGNVDAELAGKRGYRQFEYLNEELPDVLAMSSLVISRAGATSLFEFLGLKKPMLLIPLSLQASRGDQILNAASFEKAGYADVLPEEQLTAETLAARVEALYANRERYIAAMSARQDTDAVAAIVSLIEASSLKA
ncbi:glycosyltransferase, partial [Paenibacillus whitsoniae]